MAIDYEVEYNNRARVPEHPQIFARWTRDGAAYREETAKRAAPSSASNTAPRRARPSTCSSRRGGGDGPLALFIHGGYWRSLEPSSFSQMARGMNAHGVTVAVSGYDLAPAGVDRADHRADAGRLPVPVEALQAAHHGQRPFRRRPSRRLHGRDRLEDARRRRAGRSGAGRLCDLRAVRSRAAAASRHQRRLQARRSRGAAHLAAVLAGRARAACSTPWSAARSPRSSCGSRRIVADGWREQGRRDALRGDPRHEPLHDLRSDDWTPTAR